MEKYVPGEVYHVDSLVFGGNILFAQPHKYARPPMNVAHQGGVFVSRTLPRQSDEGQAILAMNEKINALDSADYGATAGPVKIYNLFQPFDETRPAMKWDGEWHITLEVFRDLGLAFCVVLVLIYMLMVGWFKNYMPPLVVMAAIPFSLIGILPAHWAFGAFFTATSMIGFMAGAFRRADLLGPVSLVGVAIMAVAFSSCIFSMRAWVSSTPPGTTSHPSFSAA